MPAGECRIVSDAWQQCRELRLWLARSEPSEPSEQLEEVAPSPGKHTTNRSASSLRSTLRSRAWSRTKITSSS
jgi:hypothetical protein